MDGQLMQQEVINHNPVITDPLDAVLKHFQYKINKTIQNKPFLCKKK